MNEKCGRKLMENKISMKNCHLWDIWDNCHLWDMSFITGLLYSIFVFLYCKAVEESRKCTKPRYSYSSFRAPKFDTSFDFDIVVLKLI